LEALASRPIAVSIKTKWPEANATEAELQIGIWHASQWKLLAATVSKPDLDRLPFLPAIISYGQSWRFVFTTRKGPKTVGAFALVFYFSTKIHGDLLTSRPDRSSGGISISA